MDNCFGGFRIYCSKRLVDLVIFRKTTGKAQASGPTGRASHKADDVVMASKKVLELLITGTQRRSID